MPGDASECIKEDANKKTSFDSKVPEEAHSVDPLPLKANVTALPDELLIAPSSNIFSFSLSCMGQCFISMASTGCHLQTMRANVNLPRAHFCARGAIGLGANTVVKRRGADSGIYIR